MLSLKFTGNKLCSLSRIALQNKSLLLCPSFKLSSIDLKRHSSHITKDANVKLVYVGPLKKQFWAVKIFSLSTSSMTLPCQTVLAYNMILNDQYLSATILTIVASCFSIVTPFLLHHLAKRYCLELTFDESTKTFTASTYNFFSAITKMNFKAEDVVKPEIPGFMTNFVANKRPLFVDPKLVLEPDIFKHLMGYDKPMNFFLKDKPVEEA